MKTEISGFRLPKRIARNCLTLLCAAMLVPGDVTALAQSQPAAGSTQPAAGPTQQAAPKIPTDQLDSLVAPIALYPDPLLAQVLVASTYPLEIVQLQQWLVKHPGLKDQALVTAVEKEDWDPSIQGMAALPDVVKRLANDIKWTTDLGNAFLAQQSDVMDAVQRMRKKAQGTGNLKSSEQQKVETKVVESKQVIVIQQSNPQVVYVPSYDPVVVYGAPVYPYPPIYYPPPGYYAAGMAISFGVGIAMGAAWGGGWGYGSGWGGNNDITINNNNNFNRNSNVNGGDRNRVSNQPAGGGNRGGGAGNNWQHNPQHRGGAPYGNRATADRFGGQARGDSMANRQSGARQQIGRQGGNLASNRAGGAGGAGVSNRAAGGAGNLGSNRSSGGGDRIGNRSVSPSSSAGNRGGAFNGASSMSGNGARASSQRGASSMGSRGGGGGRSGGGGRRR